MLMCHLAFTHFAIDEEGSTVQHLNTGFEMEHGEFEEKFVFQEV